MKLFSSADSKCCRGHGLHEPKTKSRNPVLHKTIMSLVLTATPPRSSRRLSIDEIPAASGSPNTLPFLLVLLAGSGCAALIYEIVWLQLLQLVIGSSAISLGLLLAAYMGGLCLGSALFPRMVSASRHPLRIYAFIELGIGALGLLVLWGAPLVSRLYLFGATGGVAGIVLRGLVACICLLPPTVLMGASLPAIARWLETTPKGISSLGFLYSSNIAGAVFGALFAGFYLLRVFDMAVATYVAAALNALLRPRVSRLRRVQDTRPRTEVRRGDDPREPGATFVYLAIAFSGLSALGAQVVWTRLLSLLLGATVYPFRSSWLFFSWACGPAAEQAPSWQGVHRIPGCSLRDLRFFSHFRSRGPLMRWQIPCRDGPLIHGCR